MRSRGESKEGILGQDLISEEKGRQTTTHVKIVWLFFRKFEEKEVGLL
jgi:hypothetical protein